MVICDAGAIAELFMSESMSHGAHSRSSRVLIPAVCRLRKVRMYFFCVDDKRRRALLCFILPQFVPNVLETFLRGPSGQRGLRLHPEDAGYRRLPEFIDMAGHTDVVGMSGLVERDPSAALVDVCCYCCHCLSLSMAVCSSRK